MDATPEGEGWETLEVTIPGTTRRELFFSFLWFGMLLAVIVWASGYAPWVYGGAVLGGIGVALLGNEATELLTIDRHRVTSRKGRREISVPLSRIDNIDLSYDRDNRYLWLVSRYDKVLEVPLDPAAETFRRTLFQRLATGTQHRVDPQVRALMGVGSADEVADAYARRSGYAGWIDKRAGRSVSMGRVFVGYLIVASPVIAVAVLTGHTDRGPLTAMVAPVAGLYWFALVPWWYGREGRARQTPTHG